MNKKIEELLRILDMGEDDQVICLTALGIVLMTRDNDHKNERLESLADAAFRLRDGCHDPFGWCAWDRACWEVWKYYHKLHGSNIAEREHLSRDTKEKYCLSWMCFWAEPIHWILTALITKEIVADSEEKFDAHLIELPKRQVVKYGIAQEYLGPKEDGDGYGFWKGPNPSLEEMLEVDGRDNDSVIWRFNEDGTDDLIYRWVSFRWVPMLEIRGE